MTVKDNSFIILVVAILGSIMLGLIVLANKSIAETQYTRGYMEACQDFYKGKLKMDLKEFPDGTKSWVWIESNNK